MSYCPHCSELLTKPVKICPYCKKSVDMSLFSKMVEPGETSSKNKKVKRTIWLREHASIIWPMITLILGVVIGAILLFSYGELKFASERTEYEEKITQLQDEIKQKEQAANNSSQGFQEQLDAKDQIITILSEQKDILGRIINFTNRLSRNSTITPNTQQEADFFQRNVLYLNNQFETEQEKLKEIEFTPINTYNLQPVPQLMSQE